ncbi:dihydrofolate reductase family protein [Actinotalea fermentans]|uniref:Bacterial bifunctional deaminase-reductase C-terminal domain-containing protein n=1 Tax=Actinotalea fermentans TaxID=43671 RepID=A0A511YU90_9CELL|nr:dihydrofolate reductase family protein [Actinotalea fermentans]KGM17152.1 hypothetical protein N867_09480 [Actinotalea fermentans ATCC 43279 = JCM 9966 = DSM 3133]GEN78763.1 hypothetical protein AFE02nite_04970 [Actinotalea fermentans]
MADVPTLEVLLPPGAEPIGPDDAARLDEHYGEPRLPWLRANMIATLDGAATGPDGRSGSINGAADHRVFEALRAWADVVLVGAGTVRAEGYRAPRTPEHLRDARLRRGQPDHPPLAVVTGGGDLPDAVLQDDPAPWVVTTTHAPGLSRLRRHLPRGRLLVHDGAVDLEAVVDALVDAGLPRILVEGGPTLLGALLHARLLDELCLTSSPVVVAGPAPRPVVAPAWLTPPVDAHLAGLLHCDGVLLGRWLLRA